MGNNYSKEDINQINILGTELNPNFEKLFHIENLPENENIIIVKEKNKIKGFLHYSKIYECLEIQNIIVDKMWRNNGYASALLDNLIQNNKDAKKILLEVNENNEEAIKFYQKHKFVEINRRPKYYQNGDAIIMERVLWKKMYIF